MSDDALRELLTAIADGREVDASLMQRVRDGDERIADLAQQVADRFTRLHRRDNEFAAVIAMTHDLVATRSGSLLQSIVDRAHELLGSDITYVSAFDQSQRTFQVRAVRGAVSPGMLGLVVPRGVGIATRVVETMAPIWVDNYFAAEHFPHDDEIDDVLHAEQVYSILGVPLIADQRILGVLFVADRRMRRYSPEDISLARSFADHAAIVLEQSELVSDLHAASTRARLVAEDVRRASALHEHLTRLVAGGSDPETVARALAETLGRRIAVVDSESRLFAGDPALLDDTPQLRSALATAVADGTSVSVDVGQVGYVAAIVVQQSVAGALLVERGDKPLTEWDTRSIERSGIAFALLWMQERAEELADERIRGELAHELTNTRGRDYAIERVRARGMNPADAWSLAHFELESTPADRLLASLRRTQDVLVTQTNGVFWALAPQGSASEHMKRAFASVGLPLPLIVTAEADDLPRLLDEIPAATGALRLLAGMGECRGVFNATTFAPYTVLFDGDGSRAADFIESTLHDVLAWDERRGTDLFETLLASLDEQGSITGIARRLRVHQNTVRQRLDRISTMLPEGWQLPDARFRLETAVRLEAARRSLSLQ